MPDRDDLVRDLSALGDPELLSVVNEVLGPRQTSKALLVARPRRGDGVVVTRGFKSPPPP